MDKSTRYKIFNDPVLGFMSVPKGNILRLIDHPYVQRLRRVRQLGLGYLVFPAAEHSRFSHALGALELGQRVLNNLREKDTTISEREYESTLMCLLLHDVGHGPLSHTLEHTFIQDFQHEQMSMAVMKKLNREFDGMLEVAIQIFTNQYPKKFLYQLISSQLDLDRLDYLRRDSFFTGVSEGSVGINRILKTMKVYKGNIVIEKKGIYALENYIISRRLMYMQVYNHKTVMSADALLRKIFQRVSDLIEAKVEIPHPSEALEFFLTHHPSAKKGIADPLIEQFMRMDDHDVYVSIKAWARCQDPILSDLCNRFLNRDLFRTTFLESDADEDLIRSVHQQTVELLKQRKQPHSDEEARYYYSNNRTLLEAYKYANESIWILDDDEIVEFSKAADTQSILALTKPVVKHYIVHLKDINL